VGYNPCVGRPVFLPLDPNIQGQFLASVAGKVASLILAVFPVTIFKNGLTMVTISRFSDRPNLHFLTVLLHKHVGIPSSSCFLRSQLFSICG
jgi:hypothetical protein